MIRPVQVVAPLPLTITISSSSRRRNCAKIVFQLAECNPFHLNSCIFKKICHIEPESKSSLAYYYYYYVDFFSDDTHIAAAVVVAFLALVEADEALR